MVTTPDSAPAQAANAPKRRRVFLWVFLAVQALFILWIAGGVSSSRSAASSSDCTFLSASDCQAAADAGTAIGVGLVIFLWAAVDTILGIVYLVVRSNRKRMA